MVSAGADDVFVAKVSVNGDWLWAVKGGGVGLDSGTSVAIHTDGSSMVTGSYRGTANFGSIQLTAIDYGVFVAKLSPSGEWTWVISASGSGRNSGEAIAVLLDGSSIVTGSFQATANFGSTSLTAVGFNDAFVARIGPSGDWVWSVKAGGVSGINFGTSVSVYTDGSAVIGGQFTPQITFGSAALQSEGSSDIFVAKVSSSGVFG